MYERTWKIVAAEDSVSMKISVAGHGVMLPGKGAFILVGRGELVGKEGPMINCV